jgi:hypothetical protein
MGIPIRMGKILSGVTTAVTPDFNTEAEGKPTK